MNPWIKHNLLASVCALAALPASGQGVPTIDWRSILLDGRLFAEEQLMTDEDQAEVEERDRHSTLHQDQLNQIDETLELLTRTSTFGGPLEGLSGFEASEVYAIDDNNPHAGRIFGDARQTIEEMIIETARRHSDHPALRRAGINPTEFRCWFQALIKQESNFSIGAKSPADAFGLTQIIPGTARDLGIYPEYYENPQLQLDGGARYLLQQLDSFGRIELALAAYNAGPGAVQKYGGIPPFEETQNYVVRISGFYNKYAATMSGVDMAGTLTPQELAIAETSNIADAGMHYANHSATQLAQSLTRMKGILEQIPGTTSVKEAMDLNTYARAEVARMASVLVRLQAVQRRVEAQRYALIWAAQMRDEGFIQMGDDS
ncbi:lytic transglycosylase domain-containing protein [uncultured Tateyamaria sp.]|uniref:lytic transglycosylase domain-containing protein n=1 Tax=uncultured Tateyamaria sp. TaxID=455651 RepID=UPI002622963F|nr:lytic transglycosylase domain-containing protein [uncultured Tateyamaria sp.]